MLIWLQVIAHLFVALVAIWHTRYLRRGWESCLWNESRLVFAIRRVARRVQTSSLINLDVVIDSRNGEFGSMTLSV
jgi:hypothetical protein